ncbi:MAG: hypothetical protein WEE50_04350 [Chloroflexota bacterium]
MPFPFVPVGAIVAGAILGAALTIFVWTLMALDRMASRAADSVVSGLVSGLRGWSADRTAPPDRVPTSPTSPAGDSTELADRPVPVDRVHATIR